MAKVYAPLHVMHLKVCNAARAAVEFSLANCGFGFYYFEFLHWPLRSGTKTHHVDRN